ncbi:MAG TPA: nucleotidyltransferase domain-containing protein [Thermodesulfobacteriota bacterium]|nr:nucleotidyltransferase domain-containing protein [Thermodesulfobacteriota bacterium]
MGNSALKRETIQPLPELKDALQRLLGEKLVKLVLFGSMARGDWFERSDIDIAIVVKGLSRELKSAIFDSVAEIELKYLTPLSVIVFSEEEFNRLKERERRIALDIAREGVPL